MPTGPCWDEHHTCLSCCTELDIIATDPNLEGRLIAARGDRVGSLRLTIDEEDVTNLAYEALLGSRGWVYKVRDHEDGQRRGHMLHGYMCGEFVRGWVELAVKDVTTS